MSATPAKQKITSGIPRLDQILGGVLIGDNVLWYDDSGSLAAMFYMRFVQSSLEAGKPVIFVSFDRSPKNLFERLGSLVRDSNLTIMDCFTYGKGKGISTFLKFLDEIPEEVRKRVVSVKKPDDPNSFSEELYALHGKLSGDVRLVFESLTGMQDVWGGEEEVQHFYTHSCPRLYELNTVAYWVLERGAHSQRLRAHINQIAQVAIGLSIRRGTTTLKIIKAEGREPVGIQQPQRYSTRGETVFFDGERGEGAGDRLGSRIKQLRVKRGLSQAELARLVGVTPSTISQVESNAIFPSIPGLLKMAEILTVEPGYFFSGEYGRRSQVVFPENQGSLVKLENVGHHGVTARLFTPLDFEGKAQPYLIEIPPETEIPAHFLAHKGNEMGFVLEGKIRLGFGESTQEANAGDLIYLTTQIPTRWHNAGERTARLLWVAIS
ncbi:MAG: helix-turn-helix domain-containing protein [Desulfatibacillaceae bacterium]